MKKNSRRIVSTLAVLLVLVITACAPKATPTPIGVHVKTSVAATVQAIATAESLRALEQRMTQMAMPTATLAPTFTPMPTSTQTQVLATALPTSTRQPVIPQPITTASPTFAALCLKGTLVSETIPDGTVKAAGEDFTKTWTIKNSGSCPWSTEFDFAFVDGERMAGANIDLPQTVSPGGEITISILMEAPDKAGDFTGVWSFRDAGGKPFGVGATGSSNVSVRIVVN